MTKRMRKALHLEKAGAATSDRDAQLQDSPSNENDYLAREKGIEGVANKSSGHNVKDVALASPCGILAFSRRTSLQAANPRFEKDVSKKAQLCEAR